MSDGRDEILNEAERIVSAAQSEMEATETLTQLLGKAVPLTTLFSYLTNQGISNKTAEKMVLTVWRSWFEQGEGITGLGIFGDFYGGSEGDD